MANQKPNDTEQDILPRDQLEHYKLELARLRTDNERLTNEVDYLRQALAAALSKIPQLEASTSSSGTTPRTPRDGASRSRTAER